MLSLIYKIVVGFRNFLYDYSFLPVYKSNLPVISIGNITAGGTGKTPFVIFLAQYFYKKNLTPLIISRGYKRKGNNQQLLTKSTSVSVSEVGDEPYLISKKIPEIDIIINKNRREAIRWAEKSDKKYDLIILDDAYQHRSVFRNFNILLINTQQKHNELLPNGFLREPLKNIKRADCIIFTKGKNQPLISNIDSTFKDLQIPCVYSKETFTSSLSEYKEGVAFSGIGNPSFFLKTLSDLSIKVVDSLTFRDHQEYSSEIIEKIEDLLKKNNQTTFFTTEKDWVKLPTSLTKQYAGVVIKMNISIEDSSFFTLMNKKLKEV